MKLDLKLAYDFPQKVKELFDEYTQRLIEGDAAFKEYLELQNYDDELLHLEKKYGKPDGRLYVLFEDGKLAGCIGMKRLDETGCELKRLYVKPEFRGHRLGDLLVRRIINDAKSEKYEYMRLDTLPFLKSAIKLYERFGFYVIDCPGKSPMETSIFMKLDLQRSEMV